MKNQISGCNQQSIFLNILMTFLHKINLFELISRLQKNCNETTSVNFTSQKLEKLETRKLENDFRVSEVL